MRGDCSSDGKITLCLKGNRFSLFLFFALKAKKILILSLNSSIIVTIHAKGENMYDKLKKNLLKAGLFTTIACAFIYGNERKWAERLNQEKVRFEKEKKVLEQKIKELESRDTSFRFYEHFANGADYKEILKIENMQFVNTKENPYAKYRPLPLSKELIVKNDTVLKKKPHDSDLFNAREKALRDFNASTSVEDILENGNRFLKVTLDMMTKHNHAMGGTLARALRQSDEQNEREFQARFVMFELKTKHKMYSSRHDLTVDFYKAVFLKNLSQYKRVAAALTSLSDSIDNAYKRDVFCDSVRFEKEKQHKIDSILNAEPPFELPYFEEDFRLPPAFVPQGKENVKRFWSSER